MKAVAAALALSLCLGIAAAAPNDRDEVQRLVQGGQPARALEAAEAALESRPADREMRFFKGVALANLGRTAEALEVFRQLVVDDPASAELHNNIAVLHAESGDPARALASLETALRIDPAYAKAYENLGDVQTRLAELAYAKALQFDPAAAALNGKLALLRQLHAAPPQAAAEGGAAPARDEVARAIQFWAEAWSRRELEAYFAAYTPQFAPRGLTHAAWRERRRSRIAPRSLIDVQLSEVQIDVNGAAAVARFRQSYWSDGLRSEGLKRMTLTRSALGRWLIDDESELRRY